nr:hypothetical protein BaRGS_004891 [Batillaria attramentaria]
MLLNATIANNAPKKRSYGLNDGRFTSPNFPEYYPPNTNCILYSFFGDSQELIELTFLEFDLRMPGPDGFTGSLPLPATA